MVVAGSLAAEPDNPESLPSDAQQVQAEVSSQESEVQTELLQCRIQFRDGRKLRATYLREDETRLYVLISGVETGFLQSEIVKVSIEPPIDVQYRELRAAIPDGNADQLINLARWLLSNKLYAEALVELDTALVNDPGNPEALRLHVLVEQQQALDNKVPLDGDKPRGSRSSRPKFPLLSDDQVNTLKVYEIDLRDPPDFHISPDIRRRVIEAYSDDDRIPNNRDAQEALMRISHHDFLELMYRLRAREFYDDIEVRGIPSAFERFRDDVHSRWLVNSCASYKCHGGQRSGRLWLATERPRSDNTWATNLLILDRLTLEDGTPLLNWDSPADSPLLHLGLPREVSNYPHPEVLVPGNQRGWRPAFGSQDDRGFRRAVQWLRAMYRPHPSYPITYEPPIPAGYVDMVDDTGQNENQRVPR